jgi:hypothetical protein
VAKPTADRRYSMRQVQLSRPEADALVQAMGRLPDGATFERDCISAILKRAEVPDGKADRRRPSNYDRWLREHAE